MREPVLIYLTEAEREECRAYDAAVMKHVHRYAPSYTGLETTGRYYLGHCGHVAVRKWAKGLGLIFTETINADGLSDSEDFVFQLRDGRDYTVNVKTRGLIEATQCEADLMMQPVAQHDRTKQNVYIGASDNGVVVKLWGVVGCKQFESLCDVVQRRVMTMEMPFQKLPHTMADLARWVQSDGRQPIPTDVRGQAVSVQRS